ncbi:MAG: DegT/DnrJ/EryC1/StrS family aminotransferase [bacterium]
MRVPFGDLKRQYEAHAALYDETIRHVLTSGRHILGRELEAFEREFAQYCGAPHCIGCASGTDAITLALLAHGIGRDDTVVTAANTCVPTAAGIGATGARIALCDADAETALMDAASLDNALRETGARAVVPVHLYGQPAGIDAINAAARARGAIVIEDAAQAHGALYKGLRIGAHGNTVCWSFYPSKNLGAFGDAGAVTTHSEDIARCLRMLRNYGQERRYYHAIPGRNSRLDEIQAAVLRAKLPMLEQWNARRRVIAARYRASITNPHTRFICQPTHTTGCEHLFPLFCAKRDAALQALRDMGVECLIHYPVAIHLQEACRSLGYAPGAFPNAERLCAEELSLPMFPELTDAEVDHIVMSVNSVT